MMKNRYVWVVLTVMPVVALLPDFLITVAGDVLFPNLLSKFRRIDFCHETDENEDIENNEKNEKNDRGEKNEKNEKL
jgi:hypothetical protein